MSRKTHAEIHACSNSFFSAYSMCVELLGLNHFQDDFQLFMKLLSPNVVGYSEVQKMMFIQCAKFMNDPFWCLE